MLKQEFLAAIQAGAGYQDLLALTRQHQQKGMSPQRTYDFLQELWIECGFNQGKEETPAQDALEAVMVKVWYECPV